MYMSRYMYMYKVLHTLYRKYVSLGCTYRVWLVYMILFIIIIIDLERQQRAKTIFHSCYWFLHPERHCSCTLPTDNKFYNDNEYSDTRMYVQVTRSTCICMYIQIQYLYCDCFLFISYRFHTISHKMQIRF